MAKLERMFNKIRKEFGMDKEVLFTHVGECMDPNDVLFTDGDLFCAMRDVYLEAFNSLKGIPEAQAALQKHFGLK